ncbi:MAG TPA: hypothetical protein DEV93_14700 [Chloroflexi bacterium]|jgi:acyl carrier protein|nr:hypothetical protein [Chloroflexota bacterium]
MSDDLASGRELGATVAAKIAAFIQELSPERVPDPLPVDFPLLAQRALDSRGLRHLIGFLEKSFQVEIPDEALLPSNFGTLGSILHLIDDLGASP